VLLLLPLAKSAKRVAWKHLTFAAGAASRRTAVPRAPGAIGSGTSPFVTIFACLRNALQDLIKSEVKWLKGLPRRQKKKLAGEEWAEFKFNHHVYFMQFALVLGGVLPCHFHDMRENFLWDDYTVQFCKRVLRPWFARHETILKKLGSRLECLGPEPLEFCTCDILPQQNVTDCQAPIRLHPAPLFWNTKHAEAACVKEVFFELSGDLSAKARIIDEAGDDGIVVDERFDILRSLGMSASAHSVQRQPNAIPLHYDMVDPRSFFKDEQACCSVWLVRAIDDESAREAGEYFARCQTALAEKFDIHIKMDITRCDVEEEEYDLSAEGYARLVVAAARGDSTSAIDLFDSLGATSTFSRERKSTIKRFILVLCQHHHER